MNSVVALIILVRSSNLVDMRHVSLQNKREHFRDLHVLRGKQTSLKSVLLSYWKNHILMFSLYYITFPLLL